MDIESFRSLGFDRQMPDDELWRACQGDGLVLVTGNRNKDGPTSLEAVIGAENTPTSLPVITVANLKRVTTDRAYAEATALRLLERLIDMPLLLGAGRLYIP